MPAIYILYLTYRLVERKLLENRVQLAPFSAPLESSRSPEAHSITTKEPRMFARTVVMQLRPDSAAEFTRTIENEVIPVLRKQKGFRDLITFIADDHSEAVVNSFWDTRADAEAYNGAGYLAVLKLLSDVVEGTPRVGTGEVTNSTSHRIAAKAA
jgi:hypothetical protein